MVITVYVTETDIESGRKYTLTSCPIAFALSRITRKRISVGARRFREVGMSTDYPLPASAVSFIAAFDLGKEIHPFSFKVNI